MSSLCFICGNWTGIEGWQSLFHPTKPICFKCLATKATEEGSEKQRRANIELKRKLVNKGERMSSIICGKVVK